MQRQHALRDGALLANVYGLAWPCGTDETDLCWPSSEDSLAVNRCLLACTNLQDFCAAEQALVPALLSSKSECLVEQVLKQVANLPALEPQLCEQKLQANQRRRRKLGHYLPAMWHFRGEWFWGLDRLDLLTERLQLAGM